MFFHFRIELCSYSGLKIYPGHGKRVVLKDGKTFNFLNSKCCASHFMKRNPREIRWTVLYRRKYKKGNLETITKKRNRKTVKHERGIAGATLSDILAKRNQPPEVRAAQREQAIRLAAGAKKKGAKAPPKGGKAGGKIQKSVAKSAPRVGGKR
ncbi:hypothetical protein LOTGIDRAFT_106244 [Lottia gigantea]|uniref:Large ribosomal subunit protein eL24 n=1 Tax=Lottia gigantea TaxID=225164 RepID=V4A7X6_LOTGI|nr:hypothetical protein LOTGIDRAFT_106244 [Lottia gigantea]ESO89361.1 hypothetical protein LOTGIDRAFT_106244 [Lottia gigantea]